MGVTQISRTKLNNEFPPVKHYNFQEERNIYEVTIIVAGIFSTLVITFYIINIFTKS